MGRTRELLKNIRDMKGIFHANMGTIKDRKSKDLTEGEDIKKRWQGYAEGLCKKILMTQKTMMPLALSFFEIGMKTDLYQFCVHC